MRVGEAARAQRLVVGVVVAAEVSVDLVAPLRIGDEGDTEARLELLAPVEAEDLPLPLGAGGREHLAEVFVLVHQQAGGDGGALAERDLVLAEDAVGFAAAGVGRLVET